MATNVFASRYSARQVEEALERAMSAVQSINGQTPGVGGDVFVEALKLQKGDPASVDETKVSYAASPSGKDIPGDGWSETVPPVPQGEYLWTRVTVVFNSGEPVVFYSVSRMGMDGHGSVAAVNGVSPTSDGNVRLTAGQVGARPDTWLPTAREVGALPASGGAVTGPVDLSGNRITGLGAPSVGTDAASRDYVDGRIARAAVILPASGWSENAQTVAVAGVTPSAGVFAAPEPGDDVNFAAYGEAGVRCVSQGAGTLTFKCETPPGGDLTVNVEIHKQEDRG